MSENYPALPTLKTTQQLLLALALGPTEKLSAFMDYYLKPLAEATRSYIRDSKSMLSHLDDLQVPNNILLVTIDVIVLYLNIPHEEGIVPRHLRK